jgi:hypothetical protein
VSVAASRILSPALRRELEVGVLVGRRAAESASRAALEGLGVFADRRPEHLSAERAALRNGLRAKWRQLGGERELLVGECAYEQWHRLLFARFLAENGLLLHPQYRAPVTLAECEELAEELGEPDGWSVAARFAAEILPGIFRLDDPCVRLRLAPEGRHALEQVLAGLPSEVFAADDALGWVYQFWQKDKKDEVNASERKIGGADLGPVTQLFTENYMVRFLLENSLGAWWASRHPESTLVGGFEYLRFDEQGKPAAGSFGGWPERVAEVTVMDPCCGSGHFLVEAFSMLWQMRVEEEGLSAVEAQDAVLRDNLFGLELDPRCVQIAMFAVALQAWKPGGGWRQLPVPNIACSGIPVKAPVEEWKTLAGGDQRLENALERLHVLFQDADTLGSLIDPRRAAERTSSSAQRSIDEIEWDELGPRLEIALAAESGDEAAAVLGADASGIARAASLLSRQYSLLATNVPYLARRKQNRTLLSYGEGHLGGGDLAILFLERMVAWCCTVAPVLPNKWRFQSTFKAFRQWLLGSFRIDLVADLGAGAFSAVLWDFNVDLLLVDNVHPHHESSYALLNVSGDRSIQDKAQSLRVASIARLCQRGQQANPDQRILSTPLSLDGPLLEDRAPAYQGIASGDDPRFRREHWELPGIDEPWRRLQSSVRATCAFGGRSSVIDFAGVEAEGLGAVRGREAWGKWGVGVSTMASLPVTLYGGDLHDQNITALVPRDPLDLPALWHFLDSTEFRSLLRAIEPKLNVTTSTTSRVPFDVERWRRVAEEAGPLPEPWSDDPTQWLFAGRPESSAAPLQVAVARLLGYRWPEQAEGDEHELDGLVDSDGIVCLPSVAGEPQGAERVQQLLSVAFGGSSSPAKLKELLEQAGSKKRSLADWLRDDFFKQHCALFGNRPFIWHVWDGQREGFAALVNYHRLGRKTLEKLTYTYLGQDWVERQRAAARDGVAGADSRLAAALELQRKLELILAGEQPYDIYVRWKQLHEQPVGWEPDLKDGVRLNIRPFVEAGVLRAPFNIHWKNDRGKNPDGSERNNDIHLTLAQKLAARREAGRA